MSVTTYLSGQIVQEDRAEHDARIAREKAEAAERTHARHLANVLGLSAKADRDAYLFNLARREGPAAAERVRMDGVAAWEAKRCSR